MKKNLLHVLTLSLLLIPLSTFAQVSKTPPWTAPDSTNPPPRGACLAQGGTPVLICVNDTTKAVTDRITGTCGAGTIRSTRCDVKQTQTQQTSASAPSNNTFVPLTALPGIKDFATSNSLPGLLNNIYKICIGIAAVLAVLQIMRAGILYMGGDSITEKKEARDLISMSIIGLLLVLSPVIVFSIINPKILELNIDSSSLNTGSTFTAGEQKIADSILWTDTTSSFAAAKTSCMYAGGIAVPVCFPKSGTGAGNPVTDPSACTADEKAGTVCKQAAGSAQVNSCEAYPDVQVKESGQSCDGSQGYTQLSGSCCSGMASGGVCCGRPKDYAASSATAGKEVIPVSTYLVYAEKTGTSCTQYQKHYRSSSDCRTDLEALKANAQVVVVISCIAYGPVSLGIGQKNDVIAGSCPQ